MKTRSLESYQEPEFNIIIKPLTAYERIVAAEKIEKEIEALELKKKQLLNF
tara:strand:- start:7544 stop:7696 length:153 start_codon:yes stop_codon:yes gene_type:complete